VKEAVAEIKAAARKDPLLGGEGAVLFLEKVSPALEQVNSSSGAIGTAVNNAIEALVPFIAEAPADTGLRKRRSGLPLQNRQACCVRPSTLPTRVHATQEP
jgi:hypothetical protein